MNQYPIDCYEISISQITMHNFLLRRFFLTYVTYKTCSDLTMSVTLRVSYKNQKLLTFREHLSSSPMCFGRALLLMISVFCVVFLYGFSSFCAFSHCRLCPCPFLMVSSAFSNVYVLVIGQ